MRGKHVHALLGFAAGWLTSTLFVTLSGPGQAPPIEQALAEQHVGSQHEHVGGSHEHAHAQHGHRRMVDAELAPSSPDPPAPRPSINPYPPDMTYMPPGQKEPKPRGNGRRVLIEIGARDGDSLWSLIRPFNKEKLLKTPPSQWGSGTSDVHDVREFDVMYIIEADPEFNSYWEKILTTGEYFNHTKMPETYFYNKAVWVEDSHLNFELRGTGSRIITDADRKAAEKSDPGHGKRGSGKGIKVLESSLGSNCELPGYDTTRDLGRACDGKQNCRYRIDMWKLGGDIDGCHWRKIFKAKYTCDDDNFVQEVSLESKVEGDTKNIQLTCAGELASGGAHSRVAGPAAEAPAHPSPSTRLRMAAPVRSCMCPPAMHCVTPRSVGDAHRGDEL